MSFADREKSIQSGEPIELYLFAIGDREYFYTSASFEIEYNYRTYIPISIGRGKIELTDQLNKNAVTINTERNNNFVLDFFSGVHERAASLTIFRGHVGEEESEFITQWKGRVINITFKEEEVEISCESVFTSLKRQGLRAKYQYLCRHVLYSSKCGVSSDTHKIQSVISVDDYSGNELTVGELSNYREGYFNAGYILIDSYIYRYILAHSGSNLVLNKPLPLVEGSVGVDIFPGCNHTSDHCRNKFNNILNYGGFEHIPSVNPFSTLGSNLL